MVNVDVVAAVVAGAVNEESLSPTFYEQISPQLPLTKKYSQI
jgi:hypothetical protein